MTDRLLGVWVAFEKDIRVDDVKPLISAIEQLKGVLAVKQDLVADPRDWMAQERAHDALVTKIKHVLWPSLYKDKTP